MSDFDPKTLIAGLEQAGYNVKATHINSSHSTGIKLIINNVPYGIRTVIPACTIPKSEFPGTLAVVGKRVFLLPPSIMNKRELLTPEFVKDKGKDVTFYERPVCAAF